MGTFLCDSMLFSFFKITFQIMPKQTCTRQNLICLVETLFGNMRSF